MHTQPRRTRPSPRHPARYVTEPMAGLLACGSVRSAAFPNRTCVAAQWLSGRRSPLTVAGAAVASDLQARTAWLLPHSLIALSHERDHRSAAVQRRDAALSMGGGCCRRRDALLSARCQVPDTSLSRSASGETGSRCVRQHYSGTAPATVSEFRTDPTVTAPVFAKTVREGLPSASCWHLVEGARRHSRVRRPAWHD
jgi:hypothetical protein